MYYIKEQIESEIAQIEFLISEIDKTKFIEYNGALTCDLIKGELLYSLRVPKQDGTPGKRIPLGGVESETVQKIKYAKYCRKLRQVLKNNLAVLKSTLSKLQDYTPDTISGLLPNAYKVLPHACYEDPRYEQLVKWAEEPYYNNERPFAPSSCTAIDETRVRSKAEAMIYNMLLFYRIPFRYEQKVELLNSSTGYKEVRYPDFTILLANGTESHWEHFGLLDKDVYYDAFCKKIRLYFQNDLTIGDNLIVTCDNQHGGLNTTMIHRIIQSIILPQVKANNY